MRMRRRDMKTSDKRGMEKEKMKILSEKQERQMGEKGRKETTRRKKDERLWEDFNKHVGVSIEPGGPL